VHGYSYASFVVEVTDNTLTIIFDPGTPFPGINGLQLVPLTQSVAAASVGASGNWSDQSTWVDGEVPDTPNEIASIDGEDKTSTNVTLDDDIEVDEVLVNSGDSVTCNAGGELAAPTIVLNGFLDLNDTTSGGTTESGVFADAFGGSGIIVANTQWQNQIGSFTPGGEFTIAPTLEVIAPDGTQLFMVNDFANFGQCTADGGEIDCADLAIQNLGTCTAANNGLLDFNDCDVDNTFGEYVASDGSTCEFTNATIVGGELAATDAGVICYSSSTCDDVMLTGGNGGTHEFKGADVFWINATDPLGQDFVISNTQVLLPPGQATSVTVIGDLLIESSIISLEFDPAGWGKQLRVNDNETATITGDDQSELRLNDPALHWLSGAGTWQMDIPTRGAGRIGVGESQIINSNVITADLAGEPLIVQPKDDGDSPGFVNDGVLQAGLDAILELRPEMYDNTNGVIRADDGTVEFDGSTIFGGIIEALNGGEFRVTADSSIADLTIAPDTEIYVEDERSLSTGGDIELDGMIALQSDQSDGTGGVLSIGEDTTFSGPGVISGESSGNARIDATPNNPAVLKIDVLTMITGALNIGQINSDLTVENNGKVIANEADAPMTIQVPTTNNNLLGSDNGGQLELVGGSFFPIDVNQSADGVINAGDGSTVFIRFVNLTGGEIASDGTGTTTIEDAEVTDVDITGNVNVDGNVDLVSDLNNDGQFTLQGGTVINLPPATWSMNGSGVLAGNSGSTVNGDIVNNGADHTIAGAAGWQINQLNNQGVIDAEGMNVTGEVNNQFDAIINVGQVGFFPAGGVNNNGGTVGGVGFINGQANNNSGTFAPGLLIGGEGGPQLNGGASTVSAFTIEGDYEQGFDGRLEIELAGLVAGKQHDQLIVTGDATLAGTLDLVPIDGFQPMVSDVFTVLIANEIIGEFDVVTCPDVYSVSYESDAVVVTVIKPLLPGDLDCNGAVDIADLLELLAQWGDCPAESECSGDLDGSGTVDVSDLLMLLANWG